MLPGIWEKRLWFVRRLIMAKSNRREDRKVLDEEGKSKRQRESCNWKKRANQQVEQRSKCGPSSSLSSFPKS